MHPFLLPGKCNDCKIMQLCGPELEVGKYWITKIISHRKRYSFLFIQVPYINNWILITEAAFEHHINSYYKGTAFHYSFAAKTGKIIHRMKSNICTINTCRNLLQLTFARIVASIDHQA